MPAASVTRRVLLGWLGALTASRNVFAQATPEPPSEPPKVETDLLVGLRATHPRLVLPDTELTRIQALSRDHPIAHKLRDNLGREAEKLQTAPPIEYKLPGSNLLIQSRKLLDRIYTLALMFRLDGRTEHVDRAVKELRAAALFPNWNPEHFLDTAEMTHGFAIAYDWLFSALAPADRDWIKAALIEKGLDAGLAQYKEPAPWVSAASSWNLICNSGLAIGALAVAGDEPAVAARLLRACLDSLPRAIASYAPDGGWPDGPGYWNYGTRDYVSLLASMESALDDDHGLSQARGFERTGRFRIYSTGPTGKVFNFGDPAEEAGSAAEMFWLARRFDQPVFAWQEQRECDRAVHPDPLDLVWFYKDAKSPLADDWPLDALFAGAQAAFLRSAWDDPNALYLGVKGGDNKSPHSHMDLGSFVLDGGGVRWAYETGSDGKLGADAHNTILIDAENQDRRADARITHHEFAPDLTWVQIDLSRTYPGKVKQLQRRIGIAQKQAVLVQDTMAANVPVEPLWSMTTDAEITVNGQLAELKKGDWVLSAEIRSPHHAVFDVTRNQSVKCLVARVGARVTELDLNIVLALHKSAQPKPVITRHFPE